MPITQEKKHSIDVFMIFSSRVLQMILQREKLISGINQRNYVFLFLIMNLLCRIKYVASKIKQTIFIDNYGCQKNNVFSIKLNVFKVLQIFIII